MAPCLMHRFTTGRYAAQTFRVLLRVGIRELLTGFYAIALV